MVNKTVNGDDDDNDDDGRKNCQHRQAASMLLSDHSGSSKCLGSGVSCEYLVPGSKQNDSA